MMKSNKTNKTTTPSSTGGGGGDFPDRKRLKSKVGKRAPKPANVTETNFISKSVHVTNQQHSIRTTNTTTDPLTTTNNNITELISSRGRTILELVNHLQHPAIVVRISAAKGIRDILLNTIPTTATTLTTTPSSNNTSNSKHNHRTLQIKFYEVIQQNLSILLPACAKCCIDEEEQVREIGGLQCLRELFQKLITGCYDDHDEHEHHDSASTSTTKKQTQPHSYYKRQLYVSRLLQSSYGSLLIAYVNAALNSLHDSIRCTGSQLVTLLCTTLPSLFTLSDPSQQQQQSLSGHTSNNHNEYIQILLPSLIRLVVERRLFRTNSATTTTTTNTSTNVMIHQNTVHINNNTNNTKSMTTTTSQGNNNNNNKKDGDFTVITKKKNNNNNNNTPSSSSTIAIMIGIGSMKKNQERKNQRKLMNKRKRQEQQEQKNNNDTDDDDDNESDSDNDNNNENHIIPTSTTTKNQQTQQQQQEQQQRKKHKKKKKKYNNNKSSSTSSTTTNGKSSSIGSMVDPVHVANLQALAALLQTLHVGGNKIHSQQQTAPTTKMICGGGGGKVIPDMIYSTTGKICNGILLFSNRSRSCQDYYYHHNNNKKNNNKNPTSFYDLQSKLHTTMIETTHQNQDSLITAVTTTSTTKSTSTIHNNNNTSIGSYQICDLLTSVRDVLIDVQQQQQNHGSGGGTNENESFFQITNVPTLDSLLPATRIIRSFGQYYISTILNEVMTITASTNSSSMIKKKMNRNIPNYNKEPKYRILKLLTSITNMIFECFPVVVVVNNNNNVTGGGNGNGNHQRNGKLIVDIVDEINSNLCLTLQWIAAVLEQVENQDTDHNNEKKNKNKIRNTNKTKDVWYEKIASYVQRTLEKDVTIHDKIKNKKNKNISNSSDDDDSDYDSDNKEQEDDDNSYNSNENQSHEQDMDNDDDDADDNKNNNHNLARRIKKQQTQTHRQRRLSTSKSLLQVLEHLLFMNGGNHHQLNHVHEKNSIRYHLIATFCTLFFGSHRRRSSSSSDSHEENDPSRSLYTNTHPTNVTTIRYAIKMGIQIYEYFYSTIQQHADASTTTNNNDDDDHHSDNTDDTDDDDDYKSLVHNERKQFKLIWKKYVSTIPFTIGQYLLDWDIDYMEDSLHILHFLERQVLVLKQKKENNNNNINNNNTSCQNAENDNSNKNNEINSDDELLNSIQNTLLQVLLPSTSQNHHTNNNNNNNEIHASSTTTFLFDTTKDNQTDGGCSSLLERIPSQAIQRRFICLIATTLSCSSSSKTSPMNNSIPHHLGRICARTRLLPYHRFINSITNTTTSTKSSSWNGVANSVEQVEQQVHVPVSSCMRPSEVSFIVQMIHSIRKNISMQQYLSFLMESTGLLQLDQIVINHMDNDDHINPKKQTYEDTMLLNHFDMIQTMDHGIMDVMYCFRSCGIHKVVPKLESLLKVLLQQQQQSSSSSPKKLIMIHDWNDMIRSRGTIAFLALFTRDEAVVDYYNSNHHHYNNNNNNNNSTGGTRSTVFDIFFHDPIVFQSIVQQTMIDLLVQYVQLRQKQQQQQSNGGNDMDRNKNHLSFFSHPWIRPIVALLLVRTNKNSSNKIPTTTKEQDQHHQYPFLMNVWDKLIQQLNHDDNDDHHHKNHYEYHTTILTLLLYMLKDTEIRLGLYQSLSSMIQTFQHIYEHKFQKGSSSSSNTSGNGSGPLDTLAGQLLTQMQLQYEQKL